VATIQLAVPDSVLLAAGQSPEEFAREAKFLLALKLFELGRISSGRAAELCELPRVAFLFRASRMKVPVADLDGQELEREFMGAFKAGASDPT
jgi:predicted HTH domain antitoxin